MKKDSDTKGTWEHDIMEKEREGREEKEVIKVVDEISAKREIEILKTGITIQDLASCKEVNVTGVLYTRV